MQRVPQIGRIGISIKNQADAKRHSDCPYTNPVPSATKTGTGNRGIAPLATLIDLSWRYA